MKVLKTIVATAVIVFALTTVAVAGVRHVDSRGHSGAPASGHDAAQAHQGVGMALIGGQSAPLLPTVNHESVKLHTKRADREATRDRAREHASQNVHDSAVHVTAHQRARTHDGDGTHDHDGTHDGGGTHDSGTHHE